MVTIEDARSIVLCSLEYSNNRATVGDWK